MHKSTARNVLDEDLSYCVTAHREADGPNILDAFCRWTDLVSTAKYPRSNSREILVGELDVAPEDTCNQTSG